MPKTSAGLLMYRIENGRLFVFLVHPGGPFWEHKDKSVWGIPKGEQDDEKHELIDVAKREFSEESGIEIKTDEFISLGHIKQKNNKTVHAWAFENNKDFEFRCSSYVHNASSLSGISSDVPSESAADNENSRFADKSEEYIRFPEVDKGEFFDVDSAKEKILPSQWELIERLIKKLNIHNKNDKQKTLF